MADQVIREVYQMLFDTEKLQQGAKEAERVLNGVGNTAIEQGAKVDDAFKKIGGAIAGYFTFATAKQFISDIVRVRGEIESLSVSFRSLVGNQEQADKLFQSIREFAVNTPMQMNDLAKGAQTLLSFNIAADKVMPTLKMLGDVSMGDAQKFQSLTLAFSQMSSTGKLMGQDLLQMINAGFNPLAEISAKTGKSLAVLKDEMSKGKISVQMVEEAFRSATSEGGKFYNMLENQSKTVTGAISNLQGAWDDMLNEIGEKSQGIIMGTVDIASSLVKNYEKVGRVVADIITVYGTYKAAVITVTALEKAQAANLTLLEVVQKKLNKTMLANPYVAIATALVAVGVAIATLVRRSKEATKESQRLEKAYTSTSNSIRKEKGEIDALFNSLRNAKKGTTEYKDAKEAIIARYGQYLSGLDKEKQALNDIEGAYNAITIAAVKSMQVRGFSQYMEQVESDFMDATGDAREKLANTLRQEYGEDFGNELFQEYSQLITEGKLAELRKKAFKNSDKYDNNGNRFDFSPLTNFERGLEKAISRIEKATEKYNAEKKKAETRFNVTPEEIAKQAQDDANAQQAAQQKERERIQREERERLAREHKEKIEAARKAYEEYKEAIEQSVKSMWAEIDQAEIDSMKDGLNKTLRQIDHNYQAQIEEIEKQKKEFQKAHKQQNEKDKKAGLRVTYANPDELTTDEQKILNDKEKVARKNKENEEQAYYNSVLQKYKTYEEKRLDIAEQFEEERKALIKSGLDTDDRLKELNRQEDEAMAAIDLQIAQRSAEFNAWMNNLSTLTLHQLENQLNIAKELLENAPSDISDEDLAIARAKVNELSQQIEALKAEKSISDQNESSLDDLNKLANAAESTGQAFEELGQSIVGAFGKIVSSVGESISAIGNLSSALTKAIDAIESDASELEKSLAVLTIISALMKLGQGLNKVFSSLGFETRSEGEVLYEKYLTEQELKRKQLDLQTQYNIELIQSNELVRQGNEMFDDRIDYLKGLNQQLEEYKKLLIQTAQGLNGDTTGIFGEDGLLSDSARRSFEMTIEALSDMDSQEAKNTVALMQRLLDIDDAAREAADGISSYLSEAFGSLSDDLMDAIVSAAEAGTDAMEEFGDSVSNVMKGLIKDMAYNAYLSKYFEELRNDIDRIQGDSTIESEEERSRQLRMLLANFYQEIGDKVKDAQDFVSDALNDLEAQGFDMFDREGERKGIATASQESIDELNGRMTAVQGHTYTIAENSKIIQANTASILHSVVNIEQYTANMQRDISQMNSRLGSVESSVTRIERAL